MLLFTALTLTLCEAASGTESTHSNVTPKSLVRMVAESIPISNLHQISKENPVLKEVLKPIILGLHGDSLRELQVSLRQIEEAFSTPGSKVAIRELLVRDPEVMVLRYLGGHDELLDQAKSWFAGGEEAGLDAIRGFRQNLQIHQEQFHDEMWSPIPEGELGDFVRRFRHLMKVFRAILSSGQRDLFTHLMLEKMMFRIGVVIGDPSLKPWQHLYETDRGMIPIDEGICGNDKEMKAFIDSDLREFVRAFQKFKARGQGSMRITE